MQLVKHTLMVALRDDIDAEIFIDRLIDHISELFYPETIYNFAISGQEIKKIDFPDPDSTIEEIDKWTEKSTEVIEEEVALDAEPVFKNPNGN